MQKNIENFFGGDGFPSDISDWEEKKLILSSQKTKKSDSKNNSPVPIPKKFTPIIKDKKLTGHFA